MAMFAFVFNVRPTSANPDVLSIKRGFATVFVTADRIEDARQKAVQRIQSDNLEALEMETGDEVTIEQLGTSELAALFRTAQSRGTSILKTFSCVNGRRN